MKISLYKSQKHASFGLKPNPNLKRAQEAQSKPQACIGREHLLLNTTLFCSPCPMWDSLPQRLEKS